jgi:YfiR/HmsC-like
MQTLRKCRAWPILFAALWVLLPTPMRAQQVGEYDLKAAFLFNFLQFAEWPADSFAAADSPMVLGVLGEDPFGRLLDQLVQDAAVNGRQITVRRYARTEDIDVCHLLFVNLRNAGRLKAVLAGLNGRATLTVGDADGFLEQGGMIQFVTQDSRIRLRINPDVASAARLTLSSKLLRPAQIISTVGR